MTIVLPTPRGAVDESDEPRPSGEHHDSMLLLHGWGNDGSTRHWLHWLAGSFALYHDPERGYGPAMNGLLLRLHALGAENWFEEAQALFDGQGSMGNGAAMSCTPPFASAFSKVSGVPKNIAYRVGSSVGAEGATLYR